MVEDSTCQCQVTVAWQRVNNFKIRRLDLLPSCENYDNPRKIIQSVFALVSLTTTVGIVKILQRVLVKLKREYLCKQHYKPPNILQMSEIVLLLLLLMLLPSSMWLHLLWNIEVNFFWVWVIILKATASSHNDSFEINDFSLFNRISSRNICKMTGRNLSERLKSENNIAHHYNSSQHFSNTHKYDF